jgi:hypothetical protein
MPLYNFICPKCGNKRRRICSPAQAKIPIKCGDCSARDNDGPNLPATANENTMERDPSGPTNQRYERLDNGLMPRAVERLVDAERLHKERSKIDPTKE